MGKILALDIGEKRVGYAVSDETQTVAFRAELYKERQTRNLLLK